MLLEVDRKLARKAFRMANALDANVWAVHRRAGQTWMGDSPMFRIPHELLRVSLRGTVNPYPPLLVLSDPRPGVTGSSVIRALAVPVTAPCPQPLASPSLELPIPIGSKP